LRVPSTPQLPSSFCYPADPSGISYPTRRAFCVGPLLAKKSNETVSLLPDDD